VPRQALIAAPIAEMPRSLRLVVALLLLGGACNGGPPAGVARDAGGSGGTADAASGEEVSRRCDLGGAAIGQLAYSSDGRWLAVAYLDGLVSIVRLPGTLVRSAGVAPALPRIALTEDGGLLTSAHAGTVTVWSTADGSLVRTLVVGDGASVTLKLSDSPAPLLLATIEPGAADNVKVWRLADGILVGQLAGSPLGTFTHADEAVLLMDEATGGFEVRSFGGRVLHSALPQPQLSRTAFAMDGAYLGGVIPAGGGEEQVAILSVSDSQFVWTSAQRSQGTRRLLFLENPSRVIQLADEVRVYDHDDGRVLATLPALREAATVVASPDGAEVAAALPDGRILLVPGAGGEPRALAVPRPCP
jgi:hypothetical protein